VLSRSFAVQSAGALAVLFGGLVLAGRTHERHFRAGIEQRLSTITELKVEQIVQWRHERLVDGNYLRDTPDIARRALDVLTHPASQATRQMFSGWIEPMFAGGPYEQALLLDERLNVGLVYPEHTSGVLTA
jgi:hypothetical protein